MKSHSAKPVIELMDSLPGPASDRSVSRNRMTVDEMNSTSTPFVDFFGQRWSAADGETIRAWNRAIFDYLTFKGNPVGDAIELAKDDCFVMGDVFALTMMLFDGEGGTSARVAAGLGRLASLFDRSTPQEQGHIRAVQACARGEITEAAGQWDAVLSAYPFDFVALKLAHEAYFLVGDSTRMLESMSKAMSKWRPEMKGYGFALGQYAFALEECRQYAAAEEPAILALERERDDCWALHALIHVYEMQNRHADCLALLEKTMPQWVNQPLLLAHIWWHLALRYIAGRRYEEAFEIYDRHLTKVDASIAFRLTDGTSLLWRLELAGQQVGTRWNDLAEKWSRHAERHTSGFLDMHIAMALASAGSVSDLQRFVVSFDKLGSRGVNELDNIRHEVTEPVCSAILAFRAGDDTTVIENLTTALPKLHRIGGSNAQRDILHRTLSASMLRSERLSECRQFLLQLLAIHPNTAWILDDLSRVEEASHDQTMSDFYRTWAESTMVSPRPAGG